jgi:hypothetical protein
MRNALSSAATVAFGAVLLVACSSSKSGAPSKDTGVASAPSSSAALPVSSAPPTSAGVASSSVAVATPAPSPTVAPKLMAINKSASDAFYGDRWTVLSAVRHFPVPASLFDNPDLEIVLVKVQVTAGKKYYESFGEDSFSLLDSRGDPGTDGPDLVHAAMTKAGYSPDLKDVDEGKSDTGWLAFEMNMPNSATLTLRYMQYKSKLASGKIIPAKNVDIKIAG